MAFTNYYSKVNYKELCLTDSATTHTILKDKKYFSQLILVEANVNTISGPADLIEGSARANIMLSGGTTLLTTLYSLADPKEIYLFSKIYVVMDIILRREMKIIMNIFILLMSSQDGSKYWKNCQLSFLGYIIHLFMKLNHIL